MGCGCGGVKSTAERVPREQVIRPGAGAPTRARTLNGDGTVWNGPQHTPPAKPEPTRQA